MAKQKNTHIQAGKNTNMNKSHSQLYDEGNGSLLLYLSFWGILPKLQTLALRDEHLIAFLDIKRLIPCVDVRKRTVYTPLAQ